MDVLHTIVSVVTCALGICLICMPSALAGPWVLGIHIRQIPRAHVTTYTSTLASYFVFRNFLNINIYLNDFMLFLNQCSYYKSAKFYVAC